MNKVINAFLRKERSNKGNPLWSTGKKLFCEDTCIAQWEDHHVVINGTIYSIPMLDNAIEEVTRQADKGFLCFVCCKKLVKPGTGDLLKFKV